MSGFAGVISLDGAPPDPLLLQRMAERLAFRGPDGTHITAKPGAGFCFAFLRTGPAPQCASQPCSIDGRVWLLGDVRLDGRDDLRRKLEQHGDEFDREVTDEELILRAWRRWGHKCLPDLMGDFSFALWDTAKRRLLCVRDLMGARPFFFTYANGWLSFTNTLQVLRLVPQVSSALDYRFVGDFLLQDSCSDSETSVYQDIRRLSPGHKLEYAKGQVRVSRYAVLPIEGPLWLKGEEEYVERFQILLQQAVRDRLPEGPAAIFLSGGLDSSSIAAVAVTGAKKSGRPLDLRAYTVDYSSLLDDEEGRYAALVAEKFSIPIEIVSGASSLPYEGWENVHAPEPCHEPLFPRCQRQYGRIHAHARVVMSGYGGDDILTGQAWPHLLYLIRQARFATIGQLVGRHILRNRRFPPLRAGLRGRFLRWIGRVDPSRAYPRWLNPEFVQQQHLRERWIELQQPGNTAHPLHPIGYDSVSCDYWSGVLDQEDAAWTGVPLQLRAPFFDQRLLSYLLRLPPMPWCMEKELLRRAMHGVLPEAVRTRSKTALAEDPVAAFVRNGKWRPALPKPDEALAEFVDLKILASTLENTQGPALWVDLRPLSLNYWLTFR
jgi:asparagine synthase (glutamine-hydrolysing)